MADAVIGIGVGVYLIMVRRSYKKYGSCKHAFLKPCCCGPPKDWEAEVKEQDLEAGTAGLSKKQKKEALKAAEEEKAAKARHVAKLASGEIAEASAFKPGDRVVKYGREGVVVSALDSAHVTIKYGGKRWLGDEEEESHIWDFQLKKSDTAPDDVQVEVSKTPCPDGNHTGEYRSRSGEFSDAWCKIGPEQTGEHICNHGDVLKTGHWSCCGALENPCPPGKHRGEWRASEMKAWCHSSDKTDGNFKCDHGGSSTLESTHWSCCGMTAGPDCQNGHTGKWTGFGQTTDDAPGTKWSCCDSTMPESCGDEHEGEWRDLSNPTITKYCKMILDEGNGSKYKYCKHAGPKAILQSHWSCCGALEQTVTPPPAPAAAAPAASSAPGVSSWTVDDCVAFLTKQGLPEAAEVVKKEQYDGEILAGIEEDDLESTLKVASRMKRKQLMKMLSAPEFDDSWIGGAQSADA